MPRASQIELLGYSGQFDYPEFLAEVRPLSPPAPHAHSGRRRRWSQPHGLGSMEGWH